jgi:hypothetical protein
MTYNSLSFKNSRWNPFPGLKTYDFISPTGDNTQFLKPNTNRVEHIDISWNGGKTYQPFIRNSMIEIKLYLSNERNEFEYHIEQFITVLSTFGGLMSTIIVLFKIIASTIN